MPKQAVSRMSTHDLLTPQTEISVINGPAAQNYLVTKSNRMIREARSNLTAYQNKMITYVISRVEPDDTEFNFVQFSVKEFCALCDIPTDGMYSYVKKVLKGLRDVSFWFSYIDENGNECEATFSWIDKVGINKNTDAVTVKLSDDLKPFLIDLKKDFTSYRLKDVMRFKSRFTQWFYENIARTAPLGKWTVSVDEIRKATNTTYEYKKLRVKVIEAALAEINLLTDYHVTYFPQREGRKIERIVISIDKAKPKEDIYIDVTPA